MLALLVRDFMDWEWLPPAGAAIATLFVLLCMRALLNARFNTVTGHLLRNHLILVGLTVVGIVIVLLSAPIEAELRNDILSIGGLVVTAAIALSSTTFIGNAMAGGMLRIIRSFRTGDFLRVGEHFGRVSERSLIHTEIQTEDRDLTTLPNLYLITHPFTVIRASGTMISAAVSLGYDVPHGRAEELMLEAAGKAGLTEAYVHVLELGDFSVTYRIAGLLTDVKQLLSSRSTLRCEVLDALHGGGVEIVSPTFMNTRDYSRQQVIAESSDAAPKQPSPEAMIFDKAEEAETIELKRLTYEKLGVELAELKKSMDTLESDADRRQAQARADGIEAQRKTLVCDIEALEADVDSKDDLDA